MALFLVLFLQKNLPRMGRFSDLDTMTMIGLEREALLGKGLECGGRNGRILGFLQGFPAWLLERFDRLGGVAVWDWILHRGRFTPFLFGRDVRAQASAHTANRTAVDGQGTLLGSVAGRTVRRVNWISERPTEIEEDQACLTRVR